MIAALFLGTVLATTMSPRAAILLTAACAPFTFTSTIWLAGVPLSLSVLTAALCLLTAVRGFATRAGDNPGSSVVLVWAIVTAAISTVGALTQGEQVLRYMWETGMNGPHVRPIVASAYFLLCASLFVYISRAIKSQVVTLADLVQAFRLGAVVTSSLAIAVWASDVLQIPRPDFLAPQLPPLVTIDGIPRASTPFLEANFLAGYLGVSLIFLVAARSSWGIRVPMSSLVAISAALVLTLSPFGIAVTAIGLLSIFVFHRESRGGLLVVGALVSLLVIGVTLGGASPTSFPGVSRLTDDQDSGTIGQRTALLRGAAAVWDSSRVVGVGNSNFGARLLDLNLPEIRASFGVERPHLIANNVYAQVLSEQGILGVLFLLAFLTTLWRGFRRGRLREAGGARAVVVVILTGWLASPSLSQVYYWVVFAAVAVSCSRSPDADLEIAAADDERLVRP